MRIPERQARKHLEKQVPDPELRKQLTPNYSLGCKRILLSDDYLPAFTQPNVALNTDGIREIRERSVVDNTATNPVQLSVNGNMIWTSFAGVIRNSGGGAMSLVKNGTGTLTLTDNLGQKRTQTIRPGSMQLVTTGWTQASSTVTVKFSAGWELGVDDIVYRNP